MHDDYLPLMQWFIGKVLTINPGSNIYIQLVQSRRPEVGHPRDDMHALCPLKTINLTIIRKNKKKPLLFYLLPSTKNY